MQTVVESYIKITGYKTVRVPGFVEVGSMVTEKNHMTQYIRWWILLWTFERKILHKIYGPVQENGELGTINCTSFTGNQTLSEWIQWQGCNG